MSITRVSDNKHHWSDVVGGTILGAIGSLFTVGSVITINDYLLHTCARRGLSSLARSQKKLNETFT